jgi:dienelactone hydrolase
MASGPGSSTRRTSRAAPASVTGVTDAASLPVEMFGATPDPIPDMRTVALPVQGSLEAVPALLWLPAHGAGPRPVVLVGHGAGGHKAAPIVARTAGLVTALGLAALSIDCPYHGDRTPPEEVGLTAAQRRERLGLDGWRERNARAVPQGVADWRAALDAVQARDELGTGPAGYLGLSLGARFGLPLVAAESRIAAAVLGLFGTAETGPVADAARQISVPVLFLLQWDDELYPRDGGLRLFELLGSAGKTLHANPGRHLEFPPAELADAARFLDRQLRR